MEDEVDVHLSRTVQVPTIKCSLVLAVQYGRGRSSYDTPHQATWKRETKRETRPQPAQLRSGTSPPLVYHRGVKKPNTVYSCTPVFEENNKPSLIKTLHRIGV